MSFDMNPEDEDPHGECRHEIHRLQEEVKSLRGLIKAIRALTPDIPRENLEVMVRLAYEMEVFSGGRCAEILDECRQTFQERGWEQSRIRDALVAADSELSAIAHGRPPSSKEELSKIYSACRAIYETKDYQ